jgi:NAD(P)-dependent dehydrogenase (short-subunit alcohol dehydrogenase family)
MNKNWFVTGSSRGLGRKLVEAILAAGDKVIATARKPEELKDLSATYGNSIRAVKLDVTSPADVEKAVAAAVEAFGRIDVLINNAGYGSWARSRKCPPMNSRGRSTLTSGAW